MTYFNKINKISSVIFAIHKCQLLMYKIICLGVIKEITKRTYVNISNSSDSKKNKRYNNGTEDNTNETSQKIKSVYGNVDGIEFELLNKEVYANTLMNIEESSYQKNNSSRENSFSNWMYRTVRKSTIKEIVNNLDHSSAEKFSKLKKKDHHNILHQIDVNVSINNSIFRHIREKIREKFELLTSNVYEGHFDYFDGMRFSEYILFLPMILPIYIANSLTNSLIVFLFELLLIYGLTITEIIFWYEIRNAISKSNNNLITDWKKYDDIRHLVDFFGLVQSKETRTNNGHSIQVDMKESKISKNDKRKHKKHKSRYSDENNNNDTKIDKYDNVIDNKLSDDNYSSNDETNSTSDIEYDISSDENENDEENSSEKKKSDGNTKIKKKLEDLEGVFG